MLQRLRIPWPFKGKSENWSFADKPQEFSRDELNVRVQDPVTKRLRGAQRGGFSKALDTALGAAKVHDIGRVTIQKSHVAFSLKEDVGSSPIAGEYENEVAWQKATQTSSVVYDLDTDGNGNVFALDGNTGWSKYSADGELILSRNLPKTDKDGIPRTLKVDDFGCVYVSISEGGDHREARIWKWSPDVNENGEVVYDLLWTIEAVAFITGMRTKDGLLYTVQDNPEFQKSACIVYDAIESASPLVRTSFEVPYPTRDVEVLDSGHIVATSPPNTARWENPASPLTTRALVGETPQDYEDSGDINIWAWLDAHDIETVDLGGTTAQPRVLRWRDRSKNGPGRHMYASALTGTAPYYHERGPLDAKPAVYFDGDENALVSIANPSVLKETADQQLSLVPGYEEGAYCVIAVITPVAESGKGCFLSQQIEATLGQTDESAYDAGIIFNRDDGDGAGTGSTGLLSVRDEAKNASVLPSLGNGTNGNPIAARFDTYTHSGGINGTTIEPQACVVTYMSDGGLDNTAKLGPRGMFRLNGAPTDRWVGIPIESSKPTYMGVNHQDGGVDWGWFHGWVHEVIVIDRFDRTDATSGCFSDHGTEDTYAYGNTGGFESTDYKDYNSAALSYMEKVESYMANRWGIGHLLADAKSYTQDGHDSSIDNTYEHPYSTGDNVPAATAGKVPWSGSTQGDPNRLNVTLGLLTKWDGEVNNLIYAVNDESGVGYGLAKAMFNNSLTGGQDIYSVGPKAGGSDNNVRRVEDKGDTYVSTPGGGSTAWEREAGSVSASDFTDEFVRIKSGMQESRNNQGTFPDELYVPFIPPDDANIEQLATLLVFANNGDQNIFYRTAATTADSQGAYAVAVPKQQYPLYNGAVVARIRHPYVYLGCQADALDGSPTDLGALVKVDLVDVDPSNVAPRETKYVGVCDEDIVTFTLGGSVATPTGGTSAFDWSVAVPRYVDGTTLFGQRYLTDGVTRKRYDPVENEVFDWVAEKGELPPRIQYVENYRGRIVVWGAPDDAHNWFMSGKDDPLDWDFAPPVRTPGQAIDGNNPDLTGRIPDVINTFIPVTDDIAFIGTDSSIFRLVGDPLAGGQIDLVSRKYGLAPGKSWTQDPEGIVYAFLNYGGVVALSPTGEIRRLSRDRIENDLQGIDLGSFHVRLEWNWYDEGLHVFLLPYGSSAGSAQTHYFWEKRLDAWHPDKIATLAYNPTTCAVLDGDTSDDRVLVIGCEDGYVRKYDPAAYDDDDAAIEAWVLMSPVAPNEASDFEYRFSQFDMVTANDQNRAYLELFAASEPEVLGAFTARQVPPGRGPRILERIRGSYLSVRIANRNLSERFAFESLAVKVARAGRKRARELL